MAFQEYRPISSPVALIEANDRRDLQSHIYFVDCLSLISSPFPPRFVLQELGYGIEVFVAKLMQLESSITSFRNHEQLCTSRGIRSSGQASFAIQRRRRNALFIFHCIPLLSYEISKLSKMASFCRSAFISNSRNLVSKFKTVTRKLLNLKPTTTTTTSSSSTFASFFQQSIPRASRYLLEE